MYNISRGFKNIFSLNIINLLIVLCLILILVLTYSKNKKIDLYTNYLNDFMNKYKNSIITKNEFLTRLEAQEAKIMSTTQKFYNIMNKQVA